MSSIKGIGYFLFILSFQLQASLLVENNWRPMRLISGGNGDNSRAPAQVIAGRTDINSSASRFTGVVSIEIQYDGKVFICTGSAVSSRHIVTAGHCLDPTDSGQEIDLSAADNSVTAVFNSDGDFSEIIEAETVDIHHDYEGFNICPDGSAGCVNDDLAVITLTRDVPGDVEIYDFYQPAIENTATAVGDGDIFSLVGYGTRGDGFWGYYNDFLGDPIGNPSWTEKLTGGNIVDLADPDDEGGLSDEVWYADFDGHDDFFGADVDSFCSLFGICSAWLDETVETIIGGGDSGGPSFFYDTVADQYLLAGINTFSISLPGTLGWTPGAFGDLFGGILLNPYIDWIDSVVNSATVAEPPLFLLFFPVAGFLFRQKRLYIHHSS